MLCVDTCRWYNKPLLSLTHYTPFSHVTCYLHSHWVVCCVCLYAAIIIIIIIALFKKRRRKEKKKKKTTLLRHVTYWNNTPHQQIDDLFVHGKGRGEMRIWSPIYHYHTNIQTIHTLIICCDKAKISHDPPCFGYGKNPIIVNHIFQISYSIPLFSTLTSRAEIEWSIGR